MYAALIIDVIGSKKYTIEERQSLQESLFACCKKLNDAFRKNIRRNVDFSAGDELQGLFDDPRAAFLYMRFLMMNFPEKLRAGIGIGDWNIVMVNQGSGAQDGSAYHRAREAINLSVKFEKYSIVVVSDDKKWDAIANELLREISADIVKANDMAIRIMKIMQMVSPILTKKQADAAFMQFAEREKEIDIDKLLKFVGAFPMHVDNSSAHIVTEDKTRGLITMVADVFGTNRQSIQRKLCSWDITSERQLSMALCKLFDYLEDEG